MIHVLTEAPAVKEADSDPDRRRKKQVRTQHRRNGFLRLLQQS